MWKWIKEALLKWLATKVNPKPDPVPIPVPPPVPVPVPVPVPPPSPVPVPVPLPPPVPAPPPGLDCGKPTSVKLGFFAQQTRARGCRIVWDVSPLVDGVKASEGCGPYYNRVYGKVKAFQDGPGFKGDPVERSSSEPNLLVIATNNEADWDGDRYKLAGDYTLGAAIGDTDWRIQKFRIDEKGFPHGVGTNAQSEDLKRSSRPDLENRTDLQ